jgi:hypothetical protein
MCRPAALDRLENIREILTGERGHIVPKLAVNRFFRIRAVCALESDNSFVQIKFSS